MKNINPQSMLRVGATLQMGKYRIERYLSSGGFGNTYVAYNTEFEETIAIKEFFLKGVNQRDGNNTTVSVSNSDNLTMFAEQLNKFKKEARRIRKLHNPHIVAVHDLFEENGTAYYVMDYVDGESLAERLKRLGRPLDEQEVRDYLPQLLDALQTIHAQDIWHLDLKPGNIMVDRQGTVRLIDFGASKQASSGGATTSTATAYTEGFAPSEQMEQNVAKYGPWTDLYALGATIYNLLTCNHPPKPSDINELAGRAFTFATPVTDDIKQLILWLMSTNRQHRPQTAAEVLARIATFKPIATTDDVTIIAPPSDAPTATEGASYPSKLEGARGSVSGTGGMTTTEGESSPPKLGPMVQAERRERARSSYAEAQPIDAGRAAGGGMTSSEVSSIGTSPSSGGTEGSFKKNRMRLYTLAGIAAVAVLVFTAIMLSNRGKVELTTEGTDTIPTQVTRQNHVTDSIITFASDGSKAKYTGSVDEQGRPDGEGEAKWIKGLRYYKGHFTQGKMDGQCEKYTDPDGNIFKGTMKNDAYLEGKMTMTTGDVFEGSMRNNAPLNGTLTNTDGTVYTYQNGELK